MFWAKSRESVDGGKAGKELQGLKRSGGKAERGEEGGRKGVEEALRTNLLGGAAGRAPVPENLLARATAPTLGREAPPTTSVDWEGVATYGAGLQGGRGKGRAAAEGGGRPAQ